MSQSRATKELFAASLALFGSAPAGAQTDSARDLWEVDSGVLLFSEAEAVFGVEAMLTGKTSVTNQAALELGLIIDVLAGASPNGAAPAPVVQTFTRASGADDYRTDANQQPLDRFQDTRLAVHGAFSKQHTDLWQGEYTLKLSHEFDYQSVTLASVQEFDSEDRGARWRIGVSAAHERVHPVGGIADELTLMPPADVAVLPRSAAKSKNVYEGLFGWTKTLNANSALQIGYTYSYSEGYHTDPYKILSVISAPAGDVLGYRYEARPDSHGLAALSASFKQSINKKIWSFAYRFTQDDWDIASHTFNIAYRWPTNKGNYWEPRWRWYRQSAADFHRYFLRDDAALPRYASADRRLAEFDALAFGLVFGWDDIDKQSFNIAVDYYTQYGDTRPAEAIGHLRQQNLFPRSQAWLLALNYKFLW